MKKLVLVFTLIFSVLLYGQSQSTPRAYTKQISFQHLTVEDGLSQNSLVSMVQDSIGYLWFATQDGLNRYDGRQFVYFNKQFQSVTRPSFSKLGKLYVDLQNRFWIVSSVGVLEEYDYENDTFKRIKTEFDVSAVFQDSKQNFYLGTYGDGLYKIDAIRKDTLQIIPPHVAPNVYDFLEVDEQVFIATTTGVFEINYDSSFGRLESDIPLPKQVSSLIAANETLWIGTFGDGLYYKTENGHRIRKFNGFGQDELPTDLNIEDLLIDHTNKLWVATYGQGVYVIDPNKERIMHFEAQKNNPFALHYKDVLCLLEDNAGNVWLGTDGAGASYYDEHLVKFNLLTNKQLPSNVNVDVIRSIATTADNELWLGTSGLGLTYIFPEKGNYKTFTTENSALKSNRVVSLNFHDGKLWIGHQDSGLNIMSSFGSFEEFPETTNLTIWQILAEDENKAWLATEKNGLLLFDSNNGILKRFNPENSGLTASNIRALVKGTENDLWIGSSDNGLYKLNVATSEVVKIDEINDDIKSLWWEGDTLWIGTNGQGLKQMKWPSKDLRTFTINDGLRNQVIYGVIPDENGTMWISTNLGISSVTYEDDDAVVVENFTTENGLQGLEFNTGASHKDENGIIYFGGLEGVNWFSPKQITINEVIPETVITKLELFGEQIEAESNMSFASNQNTLTFTFSSLHFSQPNQNQFKYRLINNDERWIESGNNNIAHYTNLPPEDYRFEVISSNYDGIWNNTAAQFEFTILKPWYATTLAIVGYIVALGLLIYLVYWYLRSRWKLNTQLQLEHAETERLQKLDDFKTKLYTNISHEFRTPLTLISGPVGHLLEKTKLPEDDKGDLTLIQHNADRLLYLVNQMMDLSRLDAGHLPLHVSEGNLSILVSQLVESFQYQAKKKNIQLHAEVIPSKALWFDPDVVEKITSNLLSNGIKYTPEEGEIWLKTSLLDNHFVLTVINTYNYLNHTNLDQLFERFYQGKSSAEGIGVGLALVKELVELSHGNIVASTLEGKKIQFSVTLPVNKAAFSSSEIVVASEKEQAEAAQKEVLDEDADVLLIVDDEPQIRQFIASLFQDEYTIIEAENGSEGGVKALETIPDLVISDIMMPVRDGIEMCHELKSDPRTSHIPIILLTAKVGTQPELEGLKTGADAYITKPFGVDKLRTRVRKLIETRKQLQERYGRELRIDPEITVSAPEAQFAQQLEKVLSENITDSDFSSAAFSEAMFMSRMQLHRKLKALFGTTTSEFIRDQRLKLSEKLLIEKQISISEVGYSVGFNSPSYFMKCFKETFGCTPTEYIQKHK